MTCVLIRASPRLLDASPVPVVTQDGEIVRFFDDLIRDKIVVVNFIYTTCTDVCPITTARMAQIQDRLGDAVGRDIFLLSISIDPEHDTPEVLKEYASAYEVGPGGHSSPARRTTSS